MVLNDTVIPSTNPTNILYIVREETTYTYDRDDNNKNDDDNDNDDFSSAGRFIILE